MANLPEPHHDATLDPESKLTRTKQRWAAEGRFLTQDLTQPAGERLPPGQRQVTDWPVLDLGYEPSVTQGSWQLTIDGLVEQPLFLDWKALQALPHTRLTTDIHCVTTWSRFDNKWIGVLTRDLMAMAGLSPAARFVVLQSYDGYTTNLPIDDFAAHDAILAETWNGEPLSTDHGGPVRLVVPHLYFWKSAKWLKAITFVADDHPGFWEVRGYHDRGDPWTEQRYSE